MIPTVLSSIWAAIAPAMGNHLWQSTLCLAIAGLLTLTLRRNHARARYGVWLAASIKFLVPFSLLIGIGSHLGRPRVVIRTDAGFLVAMEQVSQPFSPTAAHVISPVTQATTLPNLRALLPGFVLALWLCGFVIVLFTWYSHWRRISATLRMAMPLREGREVDAVRRVERLGGIRRPLKLLLSSGSLEPGIFGIVRPVLVWPRGISERLSDAQMEAIMAHEVWHVRRHDNLTATIHMVVEAIFWFHPLVWWLGSRMVDERERACDEKVWEWGTARQVYAESILTICDFCRRPPLAWVSAGGGADLKKRIENIMTNHSVRKLDSGRKLLLSAAGMLAVALPVVFGLANAPPRESTWQSGSTHTAGQRFEVVSIKVAKSDAIGRHYGFSIADPPYVGTFFATDVTAKVLVGMAYGVRFSWRIRGAPSWLDSETFDIQAKADSAVNAELKALRPDQGLPIKHRLLQALLVDRFKLKLHRTTQDLPSYALVIAKNGPRLQEAKTGGTYLDADGSALGPGNFSVKHGIGQWKVTGRAIPIASLVQMLSGQLGRPVLDQAGLKGNYDFTLKWTPDQSQSANPMGARIGNTGVDSPRPPKTSGSSIFTAIQEQLGLKLVPTTSLVEVLVIDHIERPAEN